jgi:hypothetical protein
MTEKEIPTTVDLKLESSSDVYDARMKSDIRRSTTQAE